MKSAILLFSMLFLLVSLGVAQDMQYVLKTGHDTLWVKDDADFGAPNTLYSLMNSDSSSPATRVYVLHNLGVYSIVNNPTGSSKHRTVIMGESDSLLKIRKGDQPAILQGAVVAAGNTTGGINSGGDLLVKNCDVEIGNAAGGEGWGFFGFAGASERIQVDNCIMEHNLWTVIGGPPANESMFFTNDYFVNLSGYTCRRNGGVLDFFTSEDTIFVENCTTVNTQGSLWKTRPNLPVTKVVFNHNDFVDCAGFIMMNSGGDHANYSVTNNIFVNVQLQGFAPILEANDVGEVDVDSLPMGLVNLKADSMFLANGASFVADKNLAYWDASLASIPTTLNSGSGVDGEKTWVSQMIPMNTRTTAMFADKAHYPNLHNGTWITGSLPTFTNTNNLFTDQLTTLKTYAIACVDTGFTGTLASWRQPGNDQATYYTYADWPIPVDLSYSDAALKTDGAGGFPLGDMDWFPAQYPAWKAQEAQELLNIQTTLAVHEAPQLVPQAFQLQQNYPNPFNPSTDIRYTIAKAGNVTLKVFNILGQEVATLVNGYQAANSYTVNFNASNLASGVYLYELRTENNEVAKKMILMK